MVESQGTNGNKYAMKSNMGRRAATQSDVSGGGGGGGGRGRGGRTTTTMSREGGQGNGGGKSERRFAKVS